MISKKRLLKRNSLLVKILISYLVLFLIFLLSFYIYYYNSNKLLSEKINHSTVYSLLQLKNSLNNYVNSLTKTEIMLSLNSDILECINKDYTNVSYKEYLIDFLRVRRQIDLSKSSFLLSDCNVILVGMNGNLFSTYSDEQLKIDGFNNESYLIEKTIEANGSFTFFKCKRSDLFNSGFYVPLDKHNISDSILVMTKFLKRGGEPLGCILITIEDGQFYKIIKEAQLPNGNLILLTDSNNNRVYSSDNSISNLQFFDSELRPSIINAREDSLTFKFRNQKFIASYTTIDVINWKVIYTVPYNMLFKDIYNLKTTLMIFLSIISLITLLGLFFALKSFFLPVKTLNNLMKRVQNGDLNVKISLESNDELSELYNNFDLMVTKIKNNIETINKNQITLLNKQKTENELKYRILQSQINPHFLFNTLNNIKWIASMNHVPIIVDMIAALGNLLEISTNKIEDEITIKKEVSYLQDYILLQKTRYGDKFDVEINVENDIFNYKILKLILQPLIENAIIHGLLNKPGKGKIIVNGYTCSNNIVFEVIDTGCGIDSGKIHALNSSLNSSCEKFNSIGIYNINKRLKLVYGDDYGIIIYSKLEEGTTVKVLLPILSD